MLWLRLLALTAVPAATLAACGDAAEPVRARDATVELRLTDYRIHPMRVRAPDGRLTVRVRNEGRLPHNLHIRGKGGTRLKISTMLPGRGATESVRLPKGDWRMFCSIANHEELGMYASLVTR